MNKFTITQFRAAYPNDDACLDKIFQLRFENLICPKCENDKPFTRVKGRRSYQCPCCGFQVYPTKDTVFEKTTTPLISWFYAIYLQTTTRNGVAAKELERQLDVCYKTALRMAHQIKKLMVNQRTERLNGIVEIDECFIGGLQKFMHKEKLAKIKDGTGAVNKTAVMGLLQRGGEMHFEIIPDTSARTLKTIVRKNVDRDATIITDAHGGYVDLHIDFKQHEILKHQEKEYGRGVYHNNTVEGFWSQLKRTIRGTHIHVSAKHLQKYVDEVAFRYSNRDKQDTMFEIILERLA